MIEANKAYDSKKFKKALEFYRQEILTSPDNILARERTARCLAILKRPREAVSMCEEVLSLDPSNVLAHAIQAEAYYDLKDVIKSKDEIETAYAMAPTNPEVLGVYGTLLLFEKQLDQARTLLEKALEIDPNNYAFYNNLAVISAAQHDKTKMLLYTKEMYRLRPSSKNFLRLIVARTYHPKMAGILAISVSLLLFAATILHAWWVWPLAIAFVLLLFILGLYLRLQ